MATAIIHIMAADTTEGTTITTTRVVMANTGVVTVAAIVADMGNTANTVEEGKRFAQFPP